MLTCPYQAAVSICLQFPLTAANFIEPSGVLALPLFATGDPSKHTQAYKEDEVAKHGKTCAMVPEVLVRCQSDRQSTTRTRHQQQGHGENRVLGAPELVSLRRRRQEFLPSETFEAIFVPLGKSHKFTTLPPVPPSWNFHMPFATTPICHGVMLLGCETPKVHKHITPQNHTHSKRELRFQLAVTSPFNIRAVATFTIPLQFSPWAHINALQIGRKFKLKPSTRRGRERTRQRVA
jgi:hypothetical protein